MESQHRTQSPTATEEVRGTGSVADRSQSEVEHTLHDAGYDGQFGAREGGQILCFSCHSEFPAADMDVAQTRRVEGESDPSDMAILVPLTCPTCGVSGTLTLQYGPKASVEESDVLAALPRS